MNTIINSFNKITKKTLHCKSCINCLKTEEELAGYDNALYSVLHGSFSQTEEIKRFCDENLCLNCEIIEYPERFHGCGFCKRPIREKFSCTICTNGFNSWIRSEIYGSDALSHMLRVSADSLLDIKTIFPSFFCKLYHKNSMESRGSNQHNFNKFILRTSDSYYKWPGFYSGVTDKFSQKSNMSESNFFPVWIIPKLDINHCVKYTNLKPDIKMFQRMILEILETNNIKLYEYVQIDLELFDVSKIKEANSYDTRIIKPMNPTI